MRLESPAEACAELFHGANLGKPARGNLVEMSCTLSMEHTTVQVIAEASLTKSGGWRSETLSKVKIPRVEQWKLGSC